MRIKDVLDRAVDQIAQDPELNEGVKLMKRRVSEFPADSPAGRGREATLAGIAVTPAARRRLEDALDAAWAGGSGRAGPRNPRVGVDELVVGGGLHGAIYSTARVAAGFPPPLVVERGGPGGSFAVSRAPSFYLNSRNRPGQLAPPNEVDGGLNFIPGAPLQLTDISMEKFHTNADLALVIRLMLATHGDVLTGMTVREITAVDSMKGFVVRLGGGLSIRARRVIDARGLCDERDLGAADGKRVLSFRQLMARADQRYPLRGMENVAVVGSGDSAKCAVETLLGLAPPHATTVASLDWVDRVDVYAPSLPRAVAGWRETERGRYQGIGSFLRVPDRGRVRLRVIGTAGMIAPAFGGAYVNERWYDHVVTAIGYLGVGMKGMTPRADMIGYSPAGKSPVLALKDPEREAYLVGPRMDLGLSDVETSNSTAGRPEFRTALFRLAGRTAALAATLPAPAR